MTLENHIPDIQEKLKKNEYPNEQSISQGIVLRILSVLGWPIYDTQIVIPEFNIQGRRVDFALCHPNNKPIIFIEVKQPGNMLGADKQLFEYAFHTGVPLAIVTDGKEWHFYLPAEIGDYDEALPPGHFHLVRSAASTEGITHKTYQHSQEPGQQPNQRLAKVELLSRYGQGEQAIDCPPVDLACGYAGTECD